MDNQNRPRALVPPSNDDLFFSTHSVSMNTPLLIKRPAIYLISTYLLCLICTNPAAAQFIIDHFDDEHATPAMTSNIATDIAILGGEREVDNSNNSLGTLNGNSELIVTLEFFNSVRLVYDGEDGDTDVFDHMGLGGLDLASTSDALIIGGAQTLQASVTIDIALYTSAGNSSFARRTLTTLLEPVDLIVPFSEFTVLEGDGVDFSNVGAIELVVSANGQTFFYVNSLGFNDTPLPVELTSFTAIEDQRNATLLWETASELNNAGFTVEHQAPEAQAFREIAFIPGAGTTDRTQSYQYTVVDLPAGTHRFRLKQVDFDGTFAYSDIETVNVVLEDAFKLSAAYPNPFNPSSSFLLTIGREQQVRITLHNLLGRELRELFSGAIAAQQERLFTIDGADLPSGTYIYRAEGEFFSASGTVLLVK